MFTVRPTVFETNSSSEHCLTVEDGMRDIEEFPIPDDTGKVHIPLIGNADDLTETKDFVSLVQYVVLASLKGNGYENLFRMSEEDLNKLHYLITTAYKMAGIMGVDEISFEPPNKNYLGVELGKNTLALWGGCYTDLSTMEWGIDDVISRLAWAVRDSNVALRLATPYLANYMGESKKINYAAAALAMRTHGHFQEC